MPHTALSLTQNQKNMAKKITTAKDILKQKGYTYDKFDTNSFLEAVAQCFLANDLGMELRVIPKCFATMKGNYEGGYIDLTKSSKLESFQNGKDALNFSEYIKSFKPGLKYTPTIYVDETVSKNAVFALSALADYNVKKKNGAYIVSLPI